MFYKHHPLRVIIDSGAETNMIRESVAIAIGAKVTASSQIAFQADGHSPLAVKGETKITLTRDGHQFTLEALVVESIDVDVLAGVPFMESNDVSVRPAKRQVLLSDGSLYVYGNVNSQSGPHAIRRTQALVLRAPSSPPQYGLESLLSSVFHVTCQTTPPWL